MGDVLSDGRSFELPKRCFNWDDGGGSMDTTKEGHKETRDLLNQMFRIAAGEEVIGNGEASLEAIPCTYSSPISASSRGPKGLVDAELDTLVKDATKFLETGQDVVVERSSCTAGPVGVVKWREMASAVVLRIPGT
jgi:hypothetical protein